MGQAILEISFGAEMPSQLPEVDLSICRTTASQCCQYYAGTIELYDSCRDDPDWHAQQAVAQAWQSLLDVDAPTERQLIKLEAQVRSMWAPQHCGTTWIWMATAIDIWLRSLGRKGLGDNPWFGDKEPGTVTPLW